MRYVLDTNIVSDMIRNPRHGAVVQRIVQVGDSSICTSIVVAGEIRYGGQKRASERLSMQIERVLAALTVLPLESPCEQTYAVIRCDLEARGRMIGANDLWIAAQCIAFDCTLVTDNQSEFTRVEGLHVENWLRSP